MSVPARVVTGYQGGEINPVDGTLVVRQSDAHAWAEVWLEGRGWARVDPTALAAPDRIESGLAAALPEGEVRPLMLRTDLAWLRALRHRWEAASNSWNQWVIGYNSSIQRDLLARLGFRPTDWAALGGAMGGALAVFIGGLWLWAMRQRRPLDPLARSWARFTARLAARGLGRDPWEGPLAYGERLAAALPERAGALRDITSSYARLRYGADADAADIRRFERNVRSFRLP